MNYANLGCAYIGKAGERSGAREREEGRKREGGGERDRKPLSLLLWGEGGRKGRAKGNLVE